MRQWFRENIGRDVPSKLVEQETQKFCDHWRSQPGAKGRKIDWAATWRNWMRTASSDWKSPLGRHVLSQQGGSAPRTNDDGTPRNVL